MNTVIQQLKKIATKSDIAKAKKALQDPKKGPALIAVVKEFFRECNSRYELSLLKKDVAKNDKIEHEKIKKTLSFIDE